MSRRFEELDWRETPIGEISLRRRFEPKLGVDVFEIRLGDEYLMSSLFTASEQALGRLGTAAAPGPRLEVVVGGLGLGCTAHAVLADPRVYEVLVVEYLGPVIEWHRRGLIPLGRALTTDPRCRLVAGDFFALAASADGFDPIQPGRRVDAILLDVDHAPDQPLSGKSAAFYTERGLAALGAHLKPGGVFGLWSNDPPDARFERTLAKVFTEVRTEPVTFDNPFQDRTFTQTIYLGIL